MPIDSLESLAGKRVLVTGASGFVGSNLVRRLVKERCEVSVLMRPGGDLGRLEGLQSQVRMYWSDLMDLAGVSEAVSGAHPDIVFHLAASGVAPVPVDPITVVDVNVRGTLNVLESLRGIPLSRFIYSGSCFEYGGGERLREDEPLSPTTVYAASKVGAWYLIHTYGKTQDYPVVTLRLFMVYGPGEHPSRLIPFAITNALAGRDIPLTDGTQTRDLVYIDDVVQAFVLAAVREGVVGRTINICSSQPISVIEIVREILDILSNPVQPLPGKLPHRVGEMIQLWGDNTLARDLLGWSPEVSLRKGLTQTIRWVQNCGKE